MREYFFWGVAICVPLVIIGAFLWAFGKALLSLFSDWKLGRDLDELERHGATRREQQRQANVERLDTGCDHDFESGSFGLPPNVCRSCGLEQEKPTGACDHVWRTEEGSVPRSSCEKCGKKYSQPMSP